jgi:hypothetical protein
MGTAASAQTTPPFFGGPVTGFDIQVGVIESGALLDAQAVVSSDRKYVTINARPSNTGLLALQQFQTQVISTTAAGFVGGVNPSGIVAPTVPNRMPSEIDQADRDALSVLNQRGMYLLVPLK